MNDGNFLEDNSHRLGWAEVKGDCGRPPCPLPQKELCIIFISTVQRHGYLMPLLDTSCGPRACPRNIIHGKRVKCRNPGNSVSPFPSTCPAVMLEVNYEARGLLCVQKCTECHTELRGYLCDQKNRPRRTLRDHPVHSLI